MNILDRMIVTTATGYGLGHLPYSPGTWGSILGIPLGAGFYYISVAMTEDPLQRFFVVSGLLLVASLLAFFVIQRTEHLWRTHDDSRIVIDEVVGLAMALSFFEPTLMTCSVAFAIFRFLDIRKPSLIGWLDRNAEGATGTLSDDLVAGAVTGLILWGAKLSQILPI